MTLTLTCWLSGQRQHSILDDEHRRLFGLKSRHFGGRRHAVWCQEQRNDYRECRAPAGMFFRGQPSKFNLPFLSLPFSFLFSFPPCLPLTGWPVIAWSWTDTNCGSLFHFLYHCEIEIYSTFLIQSPDDFHYTRRNEWRRQDNKSATFWERSGNIRIRINPEMRIRLPDHFRLGEGLRSLSTV